MTISFAIEAQGSLVRLSASVPERQPPPASRRGVVNGMSPASRLRLMRRMARLNAQNALFLTLTFPEKYPDPQKAKDHLRALFERARRAWPRASCVWKMEAQQRGAPHFHILWFGIKYLPITTIRQWWQEICADYMADDQIQIKIEYCGSARKVMNYVSKYTAKVDEHKYRAYDADLFLDDGSYPHTGRVWGWHNAECLPWPVRDILFVTHAPDEIFALIKGRLRLRWEGLNDFANCGGTVFTEDAYGVFLEALHIIKKEVTNVQ